MIACTIPACAGEFVELTVKNSVRCRTASHFYSNQKKVFNSSDSQFSSGAKLGIQNPTGVQVPRSSQAAAAGGWGKGGAC